MASDTDICNQALIELGEKTILSLDDDTKTARIMKVLYEPTRDKLLRDHSWNFAIKRYTMALNTESPEYDYTYSYKLPVDCLRVVIPSREIWEYSIEGQNLLTDYPSNKLKYVSRITDPNLFDPSFIMSFAYMLAARAAVALTDNDQRHTDMIQLYNISIRDAKSVDAMEDGPKWIQSEEWLESRRMGVAGPLGIHRGQPK